MEKPAASNADRAYAHPFAAYVRILARGPGLSRPLTQEEARDAMRLILAGEVEPEQLGAFLMLMRYRGESAGELAGLVEAARDMAGPHGRPARPPGCNHRHGCGRADDARPSRHHG